MTDKESLVAMGTIRVTQRTKQKEKGGNKEDEVVVFVLNKLSLSEDNAEI